MAKPVIKVEGLSKTFMLSHGTSERYKALRDIITNKAKGLVQRDKAVLPSREEFFALKDVSFDINQGDRVGIIGRNGAGKSTLLKILSRITEPSRGKITIRGRIASLLEVGTGFHPELSGRENIFLNGAILGMSRNEIRRKFDEIVSFAEIEKFLDTPVKRYSSGMYVRLAFAVAAHLEPEILIVDEVLAVGDAQFQKKCLGKMEDVSRNEGRTVLFVSHSMSSLKSLCTDSLVLKNGQLLLHSTIDEGMKLYQTVSDLTEEKGKKIFERKSIADDKKIQIKTIEFVESEDSIDFNFSLKIVIISTYSTRVAINVFLKDAVNFPIACGIFDNMNHLIQVDEGENVFDLKTETLNLAQGTYKIGVEVVIPGFERFDKVDDAITFELSNEKITKRIYKIDQGWGFGSLEIKFAAPVKM